MKFTFEELCNMKLKTAPNAGLEGTFWVNMYITQELFMDDSNWKIDLTDPLPTCFEGEFVSTYIEKIADKILDRHNLIYHSEEKFKEPCSCPPINFSWCGVGCTCGGV